MGKTLVIVESKGKIQTITKYLGADKFHVEASFGHVRDLDPHGMSINTETFEGQYKVTKQDVVDRLRSEVRRADRVLIATDLDFEGWEIAESLCILLGIDSKSKSRILFNEITQTALREAVANPVPIDYNKVYAQRVRRYIDRLVGYSLSPLVRLKMSGAKSAGRVQSAVLRLCCDAQRERDKFFENGADAFFRVKGMFMAKKQPLKSILYEYGAKKQNGDEEAVDEDEDEVVTEDRKGRPKKAVAQIAKNSKGTKEIEKFMENCRRSSWKIADVFDTTSTRRPAPPFQTSSLQMAASSALGFGVQRTMQVAQKLYEAGKITYMRSDSIVLSQTALTQIADYINGNYKKEYYCQRIYKDKGSSTQGAHECIRVTDINLQEVDDMDNDASRLYKLIWNRTLASQMSDAKIAVTEVAITGSKVDDHYAFISRLEKIIFDGFLAVYNYSSAEENEDSGSLVKGAEMKKGMSCDRDEIQSKREFSNPKPLHTEASLVRKLRILGIGRPATVPKAIQTNIDRTYVAVEDVEGQKMESEIFTLRDDSVNKDVTDVWIGREKKKMVPSSMGMRVTEFLEDKFPKIVSYDYTASLEADMDDVANGKKDWKKVMRKFCDWFLPEVNKVKKRIKEDKLARGEEPEYDRKLGKDRERGEIYAKVSRYGPTVFYIDKETKKACYAKIPSNMKLEKITFEEALKLLSYPRLLGTKGDKEVWIKRGPYGYYLERDGLRAPLPEGADPEEIDLKQAVELIKGAAKKREERYLYEFSTDKAEYAVMRGEKGNFVMIRRKDKKGEVQKKAVFVGIGERDPKSITEEIAEELLKEKGERRGKGRGSKRASGQTFAESGSTDAGQSGGRGRKSGRAGRGGHYGGGGGTTSKRAGGSRGGSKGKSVSFASSTKRDSRSASKPRGSSSKPQRQQRSAKSRGRGRR